MNPFKPDFEQRRGHGYSKLCDRCLRKIWMTGHERMLWADKRCYHCGTIYDVFGRKVSRNG